MWKTSQISEPIKMLKYVLTEWLVAGCYHQGAVYLVSSSGQRLAPPATARPFFPPSDILILTSSALLVVSFGSASEFFADYRL